MFYWENSKVKYFPITFTQAEINRFCFLCNMI